MRTRTTPPPAPSITALTYQQPSASPARLVLQQHTQSTVARGGTPAQKYMQAIPGMLGTERTIAPVHGHAAASAHEPATDPPFSHLRRAAASRSARASPARSRRGYAPGPAPYTALRASSPCARCRAAALARQAWKPHHAGRLLLAPLEGRLRVLGDMCASAGGNARSRNRLVRPRRADPVHVPK